MRWVEWVIAGLAVIVAGWFVFDGLRAFIVGDYVTPTTGEYAGQLGPWSRLVSAIGIDPRSTLMKSIFVLYGGIWLGIIVCFLLRKPWAPTAMLVAAIGSLWYLPFGTVLGVVQVGMLVLVMRHGG